MRPVIILFAKAPQGTQVKTRLQPPLSPEQAAGLYSAFVWDLLELLAGLADRADLELDTDIETDAWRAAGVAQELQAEGDLALKMLHALEAGLSQGRPQVMIVASDAPTVPRSHVEALLEAPEDVALGAAEDGGYWAIACRRVHPAMFDGVAWSGPRVLEQTVAAALGCGLSVRIGPCWFDVDLRADLERLLGSSDLRRHTQEWARRNRSTIKL